MHSEMINIFPIPLLYVNSALDTSARNDLSEILERIEQRGRLHNPPSWSCQVRSSWGNPNSELNDFIRHHFTDHFKKYEKEVFNSLARQRVEAWHNCYIQEENQEPHEHIGPNATYCGVYVHIQQQRQARLEFEDPTAGLKKYCGMKEGWLTAPLEENDLILFPSFLVHRVRAAGSQERVTVSFNSYNTY